MCYKRACASSGEMRLENYKPLKEIFCNFEYKETSYL